MDIKRRIARAARVGGGRRRIISGRLRGLWDTGHPLRLCFTGSWRRFRRRFLYFRQLGNDDLVELEAIPRRDRPDSVFDRALPVFSNSHESAGSRASRTRR